MYLPVCTLLPTMGIDAFVANMLCIEWETTENCPGAEACYGI